MSTQVLSLDVSICFMCTVFAFFYLVKNCAAAENVCSHITRRHSGCWWKTKLAADFLPNVKLLNYSSFCRKKNGSCDRFFSSCSLSLLLSLYETSLCHYFTAEIAWSNRSDWLLQGGGAGCRRSCQKSQRPEVERRSRIQLLEKNAAWLLRAQ